MRIIHTADWHLGKQLHGHSLIEDQAHFLDEFLRLVLDESPDCVIIAGDLYDRAIPSLEAIELLDQTFSRLLLEYKKPVIAITGNHDSAQRVCFASDALRQAGLHVFGHTNPCFLTPLILEDKYGPVSFFPIPFLEPAYARELFCEETIRTHENALMAVKNQLTLTKRSVAIAHAFVVGGSESESERPLSIGGSSEVPVAVFDGFSYVALGHLHRPQSIGRPAIRYSGSPLKYSFSEIDHKKSVSLVTLDKEGAVALDEVYISPLRDVRRVRGLFDEILNTEDDIGSLDDYILLELLDTRPILDAMSRLREKYPHALHIMRPAFEANERSRLQAEVHRRNDLQFFDDFFEYVTGNGLNDQQREHMQHVIVSIANKEDPS